MGGVRSVEAAFGFLARDGSREALLRAGVDLISTHHEIGVHSRSLMWSVEGTDDLCIAIALRTSLTVDALVELAQEVQGRICRGRQPGGPLRVDLLWAYDPSGKPRVVAQPPTGPNEPPRPPMPPGLTILDRQVLARASACGPLAEVAPQARDPLTTRFASEQLPSLPGPQLAFSRPFDPEFVITEEAGPGGVVLAGQTQSRADMLAALAEATCGAPSIDAPLRPDSILPRLENAGRIALPPDCPDHERILRWLHAVHGVITHQRLAVRRVVILEDSRRGIHGLILGETAGAPPRVERAKAAQASYAPTIKVFRAQIELVG